MNRQSIRITEEVTRVLASFNYEPTSHNLQKVTRRVNTEAFSQNPYQATRDAILQSIQYDELLPKKEHEPKTRTVPPKQTPVPAPKQDGPTFVDQQKQIALVEAVLNQGFVKFAKVESNAALILKECENKPFSADTVRNVITQLASNRRLAINSEYKQAVDEFFQNHPQFQTQANENLLVQAAIEHFGVVTAQSLEDAFADQTIGLELSMTPAAQKAHENEAERQQIIEQLLSAKTAIRADGVRILTNETNRQTETFDHFKFRIEQMDLTSLRGIRDARAQARVYRDMPKEQLKQVVRAEVAQTHPAPTQYLPLPEQGFKVPGKEIYLPFTRAMLKAIPGYLFKELLAKYGEEQIMPIYRGEK